MRDLTARLAAIEKEMIQAGHGETVYTFSNGDTIRLSGEQVLAMFSDTINHRPNKNASFFLERFKEGHIDQNGLVHSLSVYAADPADIWGDEIAEMAVENGCK